ncbi:hypothetical protein CA11_40320 [Gimesia maris]|uniref:hypothetical protein n=1 Tax=Gimesia maris TaxID=122 RepID=UPI001189ED74|nr:hypothetical protein [Gimesia maris]QDU16203.1 hypothetical protein CA11_40320 [Gimesia maris]
MNPRRSATTGSNSWRFALIILVLLFLVAGGVFVTLFATGFFTAEKKSISREGQIAFPALSRPVRAYDAITRADLINPQTRQLNVIWLPKEQAGSAILRDLSQIVGRVVSRDKKTGFALSERDFLTKGTRPGVSAGIPPGKRSLTVSVKGISGMELLRQGDMFDLMAVLPSRKDPESNIEQAALLGGVKPPDTRSGQLARQTGIKPLVIGGTMVAITQGASQSTKGASELVVSPGGSRRKSKSEMVATLAIDPVEVSPLTEALGLEVKIFCVARSGQPGDSADEPKQVSLEGLVPVVTLSRPVDAYAQVHQDDLADEVTGRLNLYYFPKEKVQDHWLTSFEDLNGRVLARSLSRGAVVTDADSMPEGTLPGIASAAPPGMSVLTIPSERLSGLDELKAGNWFSVFQALPDAQRPAFPLTDWAALQGAVATPEDATLQRELRQGVRMVVEEVMLLKVGAGKQTDIVVALAGDDVTSLTQAVHLNEPLFVAVRQPAVTASANARDVSKTPHQSDLTALPIQDLQWTNFKDAADIEAFTAQKQESAPRGFRAVPVTARPIKIWSKLSVDDFVDPSTGRPRIMYFPEDRVGDDWVTDLNELIDRVVVREIEAGRTIRRSDLAPFRSRSGPTTGIPVGKMGIHVTGDQIRGLDEATLLQPGDQFQLVMTHPYDLAGLGAEVHVGLTNGNAVQQASALAGQSTFANFIVLSARATLVEIGEPLEVTKTRTLNTTESSTQTMLTPGGPVRTETTSIDPQVHEKTIQTRSYLFAVDYRELPAITEAIATDALVMALPVSGNAASKSATSAEEPLTQRSSAAKSAPGKAEQTGNASLPQKDSAAQPRIIEHIRGNTVTRDIWVSSPVTSVHSQSTSR